MWLDKTGAKTADEAAKIVDGVREHAVKEE